MAPTSHARPSARARALLRRARGGLTPWRVATPAVVLLSGSLFAVSAVNSDGTDLRPGRYTDLASLVRAESDQYEELRQRVQDLTGEVADLTAEVDNPAAAGFQAQIEELKDPAGLVPRTGAGVTVTLSDSPQDVALTSDVPRNWLLVHQQDIQSVVNAMWRGGATAVTIQGQRIISTTGIKCEGNSVTLQGVPYAQPYVISGVGDPDAIEAAIQDDGYLQDYVAQSERPDVQIGWGMEQESEINAPAYDGLLDLSYAEPLR
ncbi:MAG: DUF881 domain-containing protein [Actinobacteria bacterium]|uniref:Unannotated protein n=1 Tax=freshwater metagenome TaxID=449393 RepID=A0A6J6R0Y8_9ZZZZ|nr:DUF881 domain-containing protein [Actinomycetota bacterium]